MAAEVQEKANSLYDDQLLRCQIGEQHLSASSFGRSASSVANLDTGKVILNALKGKVKEAQE